MSYVTNTSDKNKKTAFFLCLFGGFLGLHRFYKFLTGENPSTLVDGMKPDGLLVAVTSKWRSVP
jgi:hypothetical protein